MILLLVLAIMTGCSTIQDRNPEQAKNSSGKEISNKGISVKKLFLREAPLIKSKTPVQAVLHQMEWVLSDHSKVVPLNKDILWSVTFGDQGVVAVKVPKTKPVLYNILNLENEKGKWVINGINECPVDNNLLEINSFGDPLLIDSKDKQMLWAYGDKKRVVVIGKSPEKPFIQPPGIKSITVKGYKFFVGKISTNESLLYYFDSENMIWISGNISESEIIRLAKELQSPDSPIEFD
ncbi:protein of unknown function [Marininema halotolerans]|uniref:DUF4367 domain-containing protein n=2 Tax=Marininema halotolerans TaxID=1155944 RepID=A0A1I6QJS6_9BACL|nr:protein of unknown function [Marininema halotolerans]